MLLGIRLLTDSEMPGELRSPAVALLSLVGLQVIIGFFAWQMPIVWVKTLHVANGALVFSTAVILSLQAKRFLVPSLRVSK